MPEFILEPYWTIILGGCGLVYLLGLEWIRCGLRRLPRLNEKRRSTEKPFVSIIIPCRDEAEHIGLALDDLAGQDYPEDRFQVIVVDDRSIDGTGEVARERKDRFRDLQVLSVAQEPVGVSPKKNAILQGMQQAQGEVIITTDGDCRFQPGWISALVSCLTSEVGVVAGLTVFHRDRSEPVWQRMQQTDYLSHSFFAAGAIGGGSAFNCNGSNLAIRREVFADVGGYDQFRRVVTGDDTLLIQRIREQGKWQIHFCDHPQSLVRSWPEETPAAVLNQRFRWGSGGLSYSPYALLFALAVFLFFAGMLVSPWLWWGGWVSLLWLPLWLAKVLQEGRVMAAGWKIFHLQPTWGIFLAVQLVHIPALLFFSIAGHLRGFTWKGQRLGRTRSQTGEASNATTTT